MFKVEVAVKTGKVKVLLSALLFLSSFPLIGEAKEIQANAKKMAALNYPQLPQETMDRIHGVKTAKVANSQMDGLLGQDWGLSNIGFFDSFTPLIQPIKASTDNCTSEITVAVVDTGIDYTHPEVRDSVWVNKGESGPWTPGPGVADNGCRDKSCNGIDDDGNGFVDDVVGWDFVNDIPLPYDTHGHGTHISGIVAGAAANGIGATGICPQVSIMPLKYYDNSGVGYNNLQNTVRAIQYAVKMGAQIINYSGGGADPALSERMAIEEAQKKGVLFIAAAGNDGHNNDLTPYYPASYPLDNIISVASINRNNQLLPSSNFGRTVNVGAPGLGIISSLPGGHFGTMSGTSQATAFVTGVAALLASQGKGKNGFDYHKVKRWIADGSRPMRGNENKTLMSAGLLSVPGSLAAEQRDTVGNSLASVPLVKPANKRAQ